MPRLQKSANRCTIGHVDSREGAANGTLADRRSGGSTMKKKGSMMNRTVKSAVAVAAIAAMSLGTLAACGSSTSGDDSKGKVLLPEL